MVSQPSAHKVFVLTRIGAMTLEKKPLDQGLFNCMYLEILPEKNWNFQKRWNGTLKL
jgi:hypothetical protein